jgi:hypothetical protein
VHRVVTGGGQLLGDARCRSGISTVGRKRQLTLPNRLSRVPERFAHIFEVEVRERIEDLGRAHPVCEHADDRRDRDPEPADARHSIHLACIDSDSAECHPLAPYRRRFGWQSLLRLGLRPPSGAGEPRSSAPTRAEVLYLGAVVGRLDDWMVGVVRNIF